MGFFAEHATVGGALSTNDSGALRLRFGALRDLIIGVTLALPDGTLASSGGKVVKNVAGYDLPKLATGALGTLGVITRAVFRLHPLCRTTSTLTFSPADWEEMQAKLHLIQDSKLAHSAFQIRAAAGEAPRADLLFEATEAGLAAQREHLEKLLGDTSLFRIWLASSLASTRPAFLQSQAELPSSQNSAFYPLTLAKLRNGWIALSPQHHCSWKAVMQATGIGFLRLEADSSSLARTSRRLRAEFEQAAGSFVLLHRPDGLNSIDAWGKPGDALPLMQAVKHRLDPNNTLNPGRFVGGI